MKRALRIILILIGMLILVFTLNLVAYTAVPSYRNVLKNVVNDDANDTVSVQTLEQASQEKVPDQGESLEKTKTDVSDSTQKESGPIDYRTTAATDDEYEEKSAKTDTNEKERGQEKKPSIIDKEYHEDCGTGEGYWLIKYEDGTMEIE